MIERCLAYRNVYDESMVEFMCYAIPYGIIMFLIMLIAVIFYSIMKKETKK